MALTQGLFQYYQNVILYLAVKRAQSLLNLTAYHAYLRVLVLLIGFSALEMGIAEAAGTARTYVIKKGDSLYKISREFGVSVEELRSANQLAGNAIYEGQQLMIPGQPVAVAQAVAPAAVPAAVAAPAPVAQPNGPVKVAGPKTYTVKNGDSLYKIARLFGAQVQAIQQANNLATASIFPGQQLIIPGEAVAETIQVAPAPVAQPTAAVVAAAPVSGFRQLDRIAASRKEFLVLQAQAANWYQVFHNGQFLANIQDNVASKYTKRPDGVRYIGSQKMTYTEIFQTIKNEGIAHALAFTSGNEGGISDLNFFDGAGSFGFIQFTVKYGSFEEFVRLLKEMRPEIYQTYLAKYGIEMENLNAAKEQLVVYAPEGYKGKIRVEGAEIIDYIIQNKELYGVLIRLGEVTKDVQIESAVRQYYTPAISMKLHFKTINKTLNAYEVFRTPQGLAALTDLSVKLGVNGARQEIERILDGHWSSRSMLQKGGSAINERAIIQLIKDHTQNPLVKTRMTRLLNSQIS